MLKLYILLALRNIAKNWSSTLINVLGLSIGFISLISIFIYVNDENSFDNFHSKKENIYRLWDTFSSNNRQAAIVPYVWTPYLIEEISEVKSATSFQIANLVVKNDESVFNQPDVYVTDSLFLDLFDFPVELGHKNQLLKEINDLLLTPEIATKYFGSPALAMNQSLEISLFGHFETFIVKGIVDCPRNSHLQFNMIIPFDLFKKHSFNPPAYKDWSIHFVYTYLRFNLNLPH